MRRDRLTLPAVADYGGTRDPENQP